MSVYFLLLYKTLGLEKLSRIEIYFALWLGSLEVKVKVAPSSEENTALPLMVESGRPVGTSG